MNSYCYISGCREPRRKWPNQWNNSQRQQGKLRNSLIPYIQWITWLFVAHQGIVYADLDLPKTAPPKPPRSPGTSSSSSPRSSTTNTPLGKGEPVTYSFVNPYSKPRTPPQVWSASLVYMRMLYTVFSLSLSLEGLVKLLTTR